MKITESITQLKAILAAPAVNSTDLNAWLEVNDDEAVVLVIRYLLKEQDQKTRHACAEAVMTSLPNKLSDHLYRDILTAAHTACLNVQAI